MGQQNGGMTRPQEVIFEFRRVGAYVKVSAVDTRSLVEVSIVGAPDAGQALLESIAFNKLRYVLAKRAKASSRRRWT